MASLSAPCNKRATPVSRWFRHYIYVLKGLNRVCLMLTVILPARLSIPLRAGAADRRRWHTRSCTASTSHRDHWISCPRTQSTAVPIVRHGDANGRIVKCSRYCLLARESWRPAAQCFARPPGKSASRERSSGDGPRGPSGRRSPYYPLTNGGNERARPSDRRGSQAHFGPGAGCQVSFVEAFDLQRYAFHRFRPELISGSSDQSLPEHNWERLWDCGS